MKLFKKLGESITGLLNTGLSLIKDKTHDPDDSYLHEKIKNGVSISSKRVLNLAGTTSIIGLAVTMIMANGVTWQNLVLVVIGVAYCIGMTYLTQRAEKK